MTYSVNLATLGAEDDGDQLLKEKLLVDEVHYFASQMEMIWVQAILALACLYSIWTLSLHAGPVHGVRSLILRWPFLWVNFRDYPRGR